MVVIAMLVSVIAHIAKLAEVNAKVHTWNAPVNISRVLSSAWVRIVLTHSPVVSSFAKKKKNMVLNQFGVSRSQSKAIIRVLSLLICLLNA